MFISTFYDDVLLLGENSSSGPPRGSLPGKRRYLKTDCVWPSGQLSLGSPRLRSNARRRQSSQVSAAVRYLPTGEGDTVSRAKPSINSGDKHD